MVGRGCDELPGQDGVGHKRAVVSTNLRPQALDLCHREARKREHASLLDKMAPARGCTLRRAGRRDEMARRGQSVDAQRHVGHMLW
eukprot:scaffold206116_cov39-Tisochrysis_lutea.AAC.3